MLAWDVQKNAGSSPRDEPASATFGRRDRLRLSLTTQEQRRSGQSSSSPHIKGLPAIARLRLGNMRALEVSGEKEIGRSRGRLRPGLIRPKHGGVGIGRLF